MEIAEIARFLRATPPFGELAEDWLARVSRAVEVSYRKRGETVLEAGSTNDRLYLVRSGAVELLLAGEELTARLGQGSCFAYPSLLRGGEVRNTARAIEDTLLYAIPAGLFHTLRGEDAAFRAFFVADEADRIRHALDERREARGFELGARRVGELVGRREPVTADPATSILDAVRLMHAQGVSTLAICEGGALVGIFTDKDLRSRVVAQGMDLARPVGEAMTPQPQTLSPDSALAEAMTMMARGGFRHVPLVDDSGALAGILSATDILASLGNSAIDTGLAIARARDAGELVEAARVIPQAFAAMVGSGVHAVQAMRFTSALGDAVHRLAAAIVEREMEAEGRGPPPCAYALVAFGSLAREEQLVGSDQDNGLILADECDAGGEDWFEAFARRLCSLLDQCGYAFCKGGIMAQEARQRLRLSDWRKRYEHWIDRPDEDAVLKATIFFDLRCLHGEAGLAASLREDVVEACRASPLFVSYLARDALRARVPLGIFRNLVLERGADGTRVFDAKAQAIMPVVDIARTLALAEGIAEVGTIARLEALAAAGRLAREDARSLADAMLFVNDLRIARQAAAIGRGEEPSNRIAPDDLSPLERDYLKDAFAVIRRGLDSLRRNLAGGIA
ncbi:putative nucleotidyltransferase substrate binding domain-containing protein [Erythrobacter sp.]|uniref:putative nucleotidyltransferase substrate binding domain-containing protein n=1 Tax=Erythrobacter sp. TaxID=1042 RepID=UPI001425D2E8|nr:putative nucleotidyltransferase substrate binding domain-containing protein [Erythrobacter sp.]QIQ85409.1 MAG: CBS domain-containing protein [Erythrobacter sp.]